MGVVTAQPQSFSRTRAVYYWILLLASLVVLDDLLFGWIFWALALVHPIFSAVIAFAACWGISYWLVLEGLRAEPKKVAAILLARFGLERKNPEIARREHSLKKKLASVGAAVPMTLLFGGVVTTLWLRRRAVIPTDSLARRTGAYLTAVYAVEFMLLHALGIGGGLFLTFR